MKKIMFLTVLTLVVQFAFSQSSFSGFFKPIPKPDLKTAFAPTKPLVEKKWRPVVTIPAFKLVETTRVDAKVDVLMLTSAGGGISYQILEFDSSKNKWKSKFSFSPATILLSGNLTADNPIDLSYGMTVGFWDNLIMIGGGYDFGSVSGRSRWFGMLSIGISFNN